MELSGISRKTGWLMAEQAGLDRPYRMQSLLGRSPWNADALRDRVRAEAIASLGDPSGVLVVDETGFLKKGEHSVGVARQYSGTAGRVENCQVGVSLCEPVRPSVVIDRRLYLPEAWAGDEPPRDFRRPPFLSRRGHDEKASSSISDRGAQTRGADGIRAGARTRDTVDCNLLGRGQDWLLGRDAPKLGKAGRTRPRDYVLAQRHRRVNG